MDDKPARRRSPLKKFVLGGVAILLIFGAAIYFFQLHRARSAWDAEVQRIVDRGEPTRLADLAPKINNPDEDAGPLLLEAVRALQEPEPSYLKLMTADPPPRSAAHTALRDGLQANQKSLDLVGQAVQRPHCRLLVQADLIDQRRSDVLKCRDLSDLLHARVLWSLGIGDKQTALTSVIEGLRLGELVGEESLTESRFTSIAIYNKNLGSLRELLSNAKLDSGEFAEIDAQLASAEQDCRCQSALMAIRASLISGKALPMIRASITMPGAPEWVAACKRAFYEPQVIENVVYWIQMLAELAAISDQPGLDHPEINAWQHRVEQSSSSLVKPYLVAAPHLRGPILAMRQQLILARWALRVDRHYRQNGRFPESLPHICDAEMSIVAPDLLFEEWLVFETYERGFVVRIAQADSVVPIFIRNCRFEVTYPAAVDLQDASDVSTQE